MSKQIISLQERVGIPGFLVVSHELADIQHCSLVFLGRPLGGLIYQVVEITLLAGLHWGKAHKRAHGPANVEWLTYRLLFGVERRTTIEKVVSFNCIAEEPGTRGSRSSPPSLRIEWVSSDSANTLRDAAEQSHSRSAKLLDC